MGKTLLEQLQAQQILGLLSSELLGKAFRKPHVDSFPEAPYELKTREQGSSYPQKGIHHAAYHVAG